MIAPLKKLNGKLTENRSMTTWEIIWFSVTRFLILTGVFASLFMGYAITDLMNEIILMMKG